MKLYHYTDQAGFLGIIQNKNLWATKIQYLNDNNEFKLALEISREILDKRVAKARSNNEENRIKRLKLNLSNIRNINMCVCSLSEEGDLLSQWRGYSSGYGGYSLGFERNQLEEIASTQGFDLCKCVYSKREQYELIQELVDETLLRFIDYQEPHTNYLDCTSDSSSYFNDKLARLAPVIKDDSFSEEAEWRLISKNGISMKDLDYRVGKSMLTPYFNIKFGARFDDALKTVIVGHTPHKDLAISATDMCIYKYGYSADIQESSIPYRSW
ncbi:DUF2971 domain-containing protein [Vibrio cholerae]|nr:DUF2971 domain-containing protein [Vibrio cholerae]EJL6377718.1 DUF2971 domain-containing protein [Vibrio cholerae]